MREALFIKKNAQKWNEYQYLQTEDHDQMADRFITLLDDLSYAKKAAVFRKLQAFFHAFDIKVSN